MSDDGSSSGEEEYEIEKILHHKYTNAGGYQYFVRWKGYGPADDCWTSAKGFSAPELEAAYWESKNKKSVTPRSSASGSVDRYARNKPGTSRREKSQESSVKRSATRRVRTYKESPTDDDYSSGSDMRAGSDSPRPKRVRQKYRGAIPTNMGRSFEEQEDEDDGKGNISTSGSQTRAGSGIFSSLGSPPAQEMDAFNCFERKVFVPKYSPPYEMTPEPEAPISDYVEATNVKIEPDTNIIQEEPVFDPNKAIEIFKREREEPIAQEQIDLISEKTEKGPDVQNSNGSDIDKDADSDLEWDDRRNTLPAPPKQEGTAHEESKTILSDVFKSGGIRDPNNVLIERLVEVHTGSPSNLERKHWLRRVEVKIPEDVWRDDYWIGMSPIDISDAYNIHCNKLIANQCFLEDNNERQRLEYIYKKRHIEKLVLTWKLLNVDHINMEKIPTKILAVVSETFTNPETNQTFRKYYGVVAFWKCPGVAQQILWSELCDKCPKITDMCATFNSNLLSRLSINSVWIIGNIKR